MTTIIIVAIIAAVTYYIYYLSRGNNEQTQEEPTFPPEKLMDLNATTVADRQRMYKRGFKKQLQFDELQRRAEESGDTETLEAIRLGTYNGSLPNLKEDTPTLAMSHLNGNPNAPVQKLKYFCIKDKGYHVSVWPNEQGIQGLDYVEFNIAGITHGENVEEHLGEFAATMEAEPTNEYDQNAIKILASNGDRIGYVPKDWTDEVRNFTSLPCTCYCYIGQNDGTYFTGCYITHDTP